MAHPDAPLFPDRKAPVSVLRRKSVGTDAADGVALATYEAPYRPTRRGPGCALEKPARGLKSRRYPRPRGLLAPDAPWRGNAPGGRINWRGRALRGTCLASLTSIGIGRNGSGSVPTVRGAYHGPRVTRSLPFAVAGPRGPRLARVRGGASDPPAPAPARLGRTRWRRSLAGACLLRSRGEPRRDAIVRGLPRSRRRAYSDPEKRSRDDVGPTRRHAQTHHRGRRPSRPATGTASSSASKDVVRSRLLSVEISASGGAKYPTQSAREESDARKAKDPACSPPTATPEVPRASPSPERRVRAIDVLARGRRADAASAEKGSSRVRRPPRGSRPPRRPGADRGRGPLRARPSRRRSAAGTSRSTPRERAPALLPRGVGQRRVPAFDRHAAGDADALSDGGEAGPRALPRQGRVRDVPRDGRAPARDVHRRRLPRHGRLVASAIGADDRGG